VEKVPVHAADRPQAELEAQALDLPRKPREVVVAVGRRDGPPPLVEVPRHVAVGVRAPRPAAVEHEVVEAVGQELAGHGRGEGLGRGLVQGLAVVVVEAVEALGRPVGQHDDGRCGAEEGEQDEHGAHAL